MSAYSQLSRRRQLFVDAYVRRGVGTEAIKEAGFIGRRPDVAAAKFLAKPEVRAAIEEKRGEAIAKAGVRAVRVLEELAAIALLDPADLFDETGAMRPLKDVPRETRAALSALDVEEVRLDGVSIGQVKKLRMHSKVEALKLLGQYLKLFAERVEHTGRDGGPIQTEELSELDKARRIAHLLRSGMQAATPLSREEPDAPA